MASYNSIVLVKQVPDTSRISGDAMNADGTIKRSALPAIFNPEDLCALEAALEVKDRFGGTVTVVSISISRSFAPAVQTGSAHFTPGRARIAARSPSSIKSVDVISMS